MKKGEMDGLEFVTTAAALAGRVTLGEEGLLSWGGECAKVDILEVLLDINSTQDWEKEIKKREDGEIIYTDGSKREGSYKRHGKWWMMAR